MALASSAMTCSKAVNNRSGNVNSNGLGGMGRRMRLFRVVLHNLGQNRPMTDVGGDATLIASMGATISTAHLSANSVWQIAESIDDEMFQELKQTVSGAEFLSVSVDESDGVDNTEYLSIDVHTVPQGVSFQRSTAFGMLVPLTERTAAALAEEVSKFLTSSLGVPRADVAAKLVSFDALPWLFSRSSHMLPLGSCTQGVLGKMPVNLLVWGL